MTESFNKVKYIEECESKLAEKFAEIDQIAFLTKARSAMHLLKTALPPAILRERAVTATATKEEIASAAFLQGRSGQRRELFRRTFFRVRTRSPWRFSAFCAPAIRSFA